MKKEKKVEKEKTGGGKKREKKAIIAHRKACDAEGTGLSHYILMDGKSR